jgi:hypothetical protein
VPASSAIGSRAIAAGASGWVAMARARLGAMDVVMIKKTERRRKECKPNNSYPRKLLLAETFGGFCKNGTKAEPDLRFE